MGRCIYSYRGVKKLLACDSLTMGELEILREVLLGEKEYYTDREWAEIQWLLCRQMDRLIQPILEDE